MREVLVIYFIVVTFLSLINAIVVMHSHPKSSGTYYPHTFFTIGLANFGFLYLALSTNLQEAIVANKVAFVSAAFLPAFLLLALLNLCQIKPKHNLHIIFITIF